MPSSGDRNIFGENGEWTCPRCGEKSTAPKCNNCQFIIYAGFWYRFISIWADKGVIWVIGKFFSLSRTYSLAHFWWVNILGYLVYLSYSVACVAIWGQTPGKALVKIKVVDLKGGKIGWGRAILRNSVAALLSLWFLILENGTIQHISPTEFSALEISQRHGFIIRHLPQTATIINYILFAFVWSEFVVLFLNKKKRALHDFIAGTVVVHDPRLPFLPWKKRP
jgi:uncharacterized RDD family membrane protein YckC